MSSDVLTLAAFAPLVQLWAGICLLFFYETLLVKSPLAGPVNDLRELHREFVLLYLDSIRPEEILDDNEYAADNWKDRQLPTIKNLASLSFFYAVFILVFIGIEGHDGVCSHYISVLPSINCIVIAYSIAAFIFPKAKLFHSYWTPIVAIGFIILYFHLWGCTDFSVIRNLSLCCMPSNNSIVVFTIFTLFTGLFVVFLRLFLDWLDLSLRRKLMKVLNENHESLRNVEMKFDSLNDLPSSLLGDVQQKIRKCNTANEPSRTDIQKYIDDEILRQYKFLKERKSRFIPKAAYRLICHWLDKQINK